ncbi:MAG: hypothetical protein MUE69_33980 [Myxococcota bacterium]|nr:hypothetical protein [Myxococcota bacterium]
MSKPLIVVVLLIAALASAALVFFAMSAFSEDEPLPAVASEPTTSAPEPEPEPAPTDAELVVRTDITDANLFVDAFDRGPIETESWRTLPLGPHRIEARRGATVIAALTVELGPNGADVELHADGTTAQAARTEPPVRVASARAREGDRAAGQPAPNAPSNEPTPGANEPAPSAAPASSATAPSAAPNEADPAPSAPTTVAAAPRVEPPPGVEPAPAAPIFGARPSAGVQVVDQNRAHTVAPPPVTPAVAPRVAAPVAPAAPPNEAQMRRALDSVMPAVRTCAGDFHGELDVTVSFAPDGTTRARIGRLPTREARYCVQGAIHERVRVPAFAGRATQIRHVYRL